VTQSEKIKTMAFITPNMMAEGAEHQADVMMEWGICIFIVLFFWFLALWFKFGQKCERKQKYIPQSPIYLELSENIV
jgi:hypothetical protein